ncbi:MAG TPA: efflux RND transporter permease subunit [Pirellulales bacterium]
MIRKLIAWALDSPLVVILLAISLGVFGLISFHNVSVEAYPDPAPAIVEVITKFPGASAEEVERQVTIPLEVTFAGMPGLNTVNSKSLFGLSDLKMNWRYGSQYPYLAARQEVINRMATIAQPLPPGVIPEISPASPTGEIYRYVVRVPRDKSGSKIYDLNDITAMQNWLLERELRRVPRIVGVATFGGTVRRYEVQPDPERLRRYGITLTQLQEALANSNFTVGGDYLPSGQTVQTVRSIGLFAGAADPVNLVVGMKDPVEAAKVLRLEEKRRIQEIRALVVATVNNVPVRVEDVVEGGRLLPGQLPGDKGVVVAHRTRLGRHGYFAADEEREPGSTLTLADVGHDDDDNVRCTVLMRKGEETTPCLKDVKAKVEQINDPNFGRLLPGTKLETYYDRTDLFHITTETVIENLCVGVALVFIILFMFMNNVRMAVIVAINIPLALAFAYVVLYVRGKSANLLSIGAVDFGIIVDSSVVVMENINRNLSSGHRGEQPMKARILSFLHEIDHALLYSVMIMVCAFIPLFSMTGPEGELFGPMAQTYAFALASALVLAVTLTPVLAMLVFKRFEPKRENFMVRGMRTRYISNLKLCLDYPKITLAALVFIIVGSFCLLPQLGREFMPELEEGNLWLRATGPLAMSLEHQAELARQARAIVATFPEVESVTTQSGRPEDGTDTEGYYSGEYFVSLRPQNDWPKLVDATGWRRVFGPKRARTKKEIVAAMDAELDRVIPGILWNFSQIIRDNVLEAMTGIKGENSLKILGPDVDELERLAEEARYIMKSIDGFKNVGIFHLRGGSQLRFRVDPVKCQKWGVMTADVNNVVASALAAVPQSTMVEGEKRFDISVRWPKWRRSSETSILDIPVDVVNNQVVLANGADFTPDASGHALTGATVTGTLADTSNPITATPRIRLGDLVSPMGADGSPDPEGQFDQSGPAMIYREQGTRFIPIKFGVRGRDLASAVAEAKEKTEHLFKFPYRPVWSGEFELMEHANTRLGWIVLLSLGLVLVLLYSAFRSILDTLVIFSNVLFVAVGGIWALYLSNTNFNVSAAVGFVSLFGIAIMDGLLLVSSFNQGRAEGLPLRRAIIQGAERRVRPVMMTALTAILGLLPAAVSTKMGSQTAQPLAIVVVGGMTAAMFLTRYLMPVLYSFYGHREPPAGSGAMAH